VQLSRHIIVRKDYNVSAVEKCRETFAPLTSAMRAARCAHAYFGKRVCRLLTFHNVNRGVSRNGLDHFRQSVWDTANAIELPFPAAITVWPALPEIFWFESDNLK
jgi:hypothetical protein